jgi:lysine 2,3-aminomutase
MKLPLSPDDVRKNREELRKKVQSNDYKSELRNRISGRDLEYYFLLSETERIGIDKTIRLNVSTTPYYLLLSDPFSESCPIRRMIVPREEETFLSPEESPDPLTEEILSPVRGLVHMYSDRVLLFSNHECSVYCRHCMRGRKVSQSEERLTGDELEECFAYIRSHPEIRDVVISGGDPLNLSTAKLNRILEALENIPHVEICRIGTRNPVTNPSRIDSELCKVLEERNSDQLSIFCNTQFNHEKECTPEAKAAILKLLKSGISVGNQAVLLKGINDSGEDMLNLHKALLKMRVRAYYLYDPEILPGSRGFRTPLYKGLEIIEYMRGKIGGMGIPQFVNDLPGGGGKITLSPNWYLGYHSESKTHVFRSAVTGAIHLSQEPEGSEYENKYPRISDSEFLKWKENANTVHERKSPIGWKLSQ